MFFNSYKVQDSHLVFESPFFFDRISTTKEHSSLGPVEVYMLVFLNIFRTIHVPGQLPILTSRIDCLASVTAVQNIMPLVHQGTVKKATPLETSVLPSLKILSQEVQNKLNIPIERAFLMPSPVESFLLICSSLCGLILMIEACG